MKLRNNYKLLYFFVGALIITAFLFNTPKEIVEGSIIILRSPANLITDYFKIANVGAALLNSALMTLKSIIILKMNSIQLNGSYLAAIFTVAGFSFFGKNLYNSIPIIFGVCLYTKLRHFKFERCIIPALFGTALGPLVSEITFNLDLPLYIGMPLGILVGIFVGLILPPLGEHFKSFHKGFSLYNIGFTAGLIGTLSIAILRSFHINIETVDLVSKGNNKPVLFFLGFLFISIFFWGLASNNWSMSGYRSLLNAGIEKRDYVELSGLGLTLMNMAILGMISMIYVLLVKGELNGPVIGGIFTIVGFGAYGKNPKNVLPIILGVFLAGYISMFDVSSTGTLLAALFGTTLAPISQAYGSIVGIIAGSIHVSLVVNISYMHAGMNLYNNGFSGGFVAATLVPIVEAINNHKENNKNRK